MTSISTASSSRRIGFASFAGFGLLFAAPVEFFNQWYMQGAGLRGFATTCAAYLVILALWYPIFRRLVGGRPSARGAILNYALFAVAGLMIEWFLIGNSPWANPAASQIGMLGWWGLLSTFPLIAAGEGSRRLRAWSWAYWAAIGALSLAFPIASGGSEAGKFLGLVIVHYGLSLAHAFPILLALGMRRRDAAPAV